MSDIFRLDLIFSPVIVMTGSAFLTFASRASKAAYVEADVMWRKWSHSMSFRVKRIKTPL